jgi:hypothetical protein
MDGLSRADAAGAIQALESEVKREHLWRRSVWSTIESSGHLEKRERWLRLLPALLHRSDPLFKPFQGSEDMSSIGGSGVGCSVMFLLCLFLSRFELGVLRGCFGIGTLPARGNIDSERGGGQVY